jgi:hypothetical protein
MPFYKPAHQKWPVQSLSHFWLPDDDSPSIKGMRHVTVYIKYLKSPSLQGNAGEMKN